MLTRGVGVWRTVHPIMATTSMRMTTVKTPVAAARLGSRAAACSPVMSKATPAGVDRLASLIVAAQASGSKSAAAKAMQAVRCALPPNQKLKASRRARQMEGIQSLADVIRG